MIPEDWRGLLHELDLNHRRKGWVIELSRDGLQSSLCRLSAYTGDGLELIRPVTCSDWEMVLRTAVGRLNVMRAVKQQQAWKAY